MPRTSSKRHRVPDNWFETVADRVWLPPDTQGEEEARLIRRLLRLRRGQRVLDAPCGAGRIAIHMARAGLEVDGIDIREPFLRRARRRFRAEHLSGRFDRRDLRHIEPPPVYHGIYTWFGSFGYFSEEENADLVQRFAHALRPGGRLLIEQIHRERILRNFRHRAEGGPITTYAWWDADAERVINHRDIDGVRDPANSSSMRLYTPRQMRRLFERAGLETSAPFGYPEGGPLLRGSRRMLTIGRKPS